MKLEFTFLPLLVVVFTSCGQEKLDQQKQIFLPQEVTISDIHRGYQEGEFSVSQVVEFYIARIDSLDKNGPSLQSVITLNPNVLDLAKSMDGKQVTGPLFGIPVLLKDNIDTGDSMTNTAGSRVLMHNFPDRDASLVAQLKEAGAIILGKTNLSEWANFHSNVSSSGWSGLGGQTKNPYRLDHNPCGSSAGSGVAVAANLCVIAIGTETNGSIVCPSNNNGIVGIKPTVGLISRNGIIPISRHQDTAGPMARTVRDAVIALGTMSSSDPDDFATINDGREVLDDYTLYLNKDGIEGKRIGYYKRPLSNDSTELNSIMDKALEILKDAGAEIVEVDRILHPRTETLSFVAMQYDFKNGVNQYLHGLGKRSLVTSLGEVIEQTFADSIEMQFDHHLMKTSDQRGELSDQVYVSAVDSMHLTSRTEGIDRVMSEYNLDAIVAPTGSPAWKTDHENGDDYGVYSSSPAAIAGYPNITVPMGYISELPVGMSIFGGAWTEGKLIEIAYAFEQRSQSRKSPKFLH